MKSFQNRENPQGMKYRFLGIAIAFVVICIAHITVLGVIQIKGGNESSDDGSARERIVSVAGLRGEIYDRNGKLLVGNATSYDVIYEYGAMPDTYSEINKELLTVLGALDATGNGDKLSEDFFALEGIYPNLEYTADAKNPETKTRFYFLRILDALELEENITASELTKAFMKKYQISEDKYTNEEITALLRLWYEMKRVDFGSYASYTIASGCDYSFITYTKELGVEGVNFMAVNKREYKYPGVASHILGTVGKITESQAEYYDSLGYPMDALVGRSGCELAFEEWLRGIDGKMVIKYDEEGNIIDQYYKTEPISGRDVWLTIDIDLQIAAEEGLKLNVESVESATAGALTALSPNTGEILAIASYPTYDLTRYSELDYYSSLANDDSKPLLNRALNEIYAPGSTYKIGVALAALEEGHINEGTCYICNGKYSSGNTCLDSHGSIDVVEAIRESCNIYFYTIGDNLGIDSIAPYTSSLGLGKSTGIELGEAVGDIAGTAYSKDWNEKEDILAAIGQSVHGYTPLQLSVYMSSIVNGGDRYSAHLLHSVKEFYTNDLVYEYDSEDLLAESVSISDKTYSLLIEGMKQVVEGSSSLSWNFRNIPGKVGGKTGTAEIAGKTDYALFSGFAPLNNPEIVVSCVIEEGAKGYNSSIAASKVFEAYFKIENE